MIILNFILLVIVNTPEMHGVKINLIWFLRECVCVQAPECLLMRVMERLSEVDELQLFIDNCGKVAMDTGRGSSDVLLRHMKGEYLSESLPGG